jgi:hypothetical protein
MLVKYPLRLDIPWRQNTRSMNLHRSALFLISVDFVSARFSSDIQGSRAMLHTIDLRYIHEPTYDTKRCSREGRRCTRPQVGGKHLG